MNIYLRFLGVLVVNGRLCADQRGDIIVLEKGRVVEQGPHEVLVSNGGRYAQLWSQQNNTVDDLDAAIKLEA
ncbi:hypothetical protein E3N88_11214 [Mikania micrantha]|uniref:Uncharacterized protein n=1 Tax=Mikania micrantha TaxID=192012 RepID=A0A5N6PD34_9ASTR|nr:hypothetical protein E3N88_11214 [Mikania micrantha]